MVEKRSWGLLVSPGPGLLTIISAPRPPNSVHPTASLDKIAVKLTECAATAYLGTLVETKNLTPCKGLVTVPLNMDCWGPPSQFRYHCFRSAFPSPVEIALE